MIALGRTNIGTAVLNSCGNNTTDPICKDLSQGRQFLDSAYRTHLKMYLNDNATTVVIASTAALIEKKIAISITREEKLGMPELTIRKDETILLFRWGF